MKIVTLILLLCGAVIAQAQDKPKLKDLLYGGKLKKDSSGVIRNTDDLTAKIDTSTKKEPPPAPKTNTVTQKTDGTTNTPAVVTDATGNAPVNATATPAVPAKSNIKLIKEYTDSLTKMLNAEVMKSSRIKKGTYFLILDYEIGTDGKVTFTNVNSTPESPYLQAQVTLTTDSTPLQLNPVLDGAGKPTKVKRKQQLSVTKD